MKKHVAFAFGRFNPPTVGHKKLIDAVVNAADGGDFYKKDLTINVLGPVGDKVEEWTLKGAFITSADFGELDWSDSGEAMSISLTLAIDYAILQY